MIPNSISSLSALLVQDRDKNGEEYLDKVEMMIDFYEGDQTCDDSYLLDLLTNKTDRKIDLRGRQFTNNITKKVVDAISMLYKERPKITIMKGDEVDEKATKLYSEIIENSNIHPVRKMMEKYTNLLNRTAVGVFFDEATSQVRLDLINIFIPTWSKGKYNYHTPEAVTYLMPYNNFLMSDDTDMVYVTWDGTQVKYSNASGKNVSIKVGENVQTGTEEHGYLSIPFVFPYASYPVSGFFGSMMSDLVRANQGVNMIKTLMYYAFLLQHFKMIVIKNGDPSQKDSIRITPDSVLGVGADGDVSAVDLSDENLSAKIEFMNQQIIEILDNYGLKSRIGDAKTMSGVAIKIENTSLMEIRQDKEEAFIRSFEIPLYEKIQQITEKKGGLLGGTLPKLGKDTRLNVKFGNYEIPMSADEEIKLWDFWLNVAKIKSRADYLAFTDKISMEDAEGILKRIDDDIRNIANLEFGSPIGNALRVQDVND